MYVKITHPVAFSYRNNAVARCFRLFLVWTLAGKHLEGEVGDESGENYYCFFM